MLESSGREEEQRLARGTSSPDLMPFSFFRQIWEAIKSGAALENPMLLNKFLLLTFAVSRWAETPQP